MNTDTLNTPTTATEAPSSSMSVSARARWLLAKGGRGVMLASHHTLAVVGLMVLAVGTIGVTRPDIRNDAEVWVLGHLQSRQGPGEVEADGVVTESVEPPQAIVVGDAAAVTRATATDPDELSHEQANVAKWIARRYKVAPEPIGRLVQEAWEVGQRFKLEPTLILAIMAVESSFNPFAQSAVGAQGLMQVMTSVHDKKYEPFGGVHAAFDPVTNLKVGVQVLKECIGRAGSLYDGLRHYVGAANLPHDSGYAGKVLGEQAHLLRVAAGRHVAHTAPIVPIVPASVSVKALVGNDGALPSSEPVAPTPRPDTDGALGRQAQRADPGLASRSWTHAWATPRLDDAASAAPTP